MQVKLLKKIVEQVAGESAIGLIELLGDKKDLNEFLIAKKLNLTINQTRNLLYRLSHLGIISSIRKKDKRKGWYIYFWTLNNIRSLEILEAKIRVEIDQLEEQLASKKAKRFYKCASCGMEVSEEVALNTEFMCLECGEIYQLSNNVLLIEEIEKKILKLRRELEIVKKEKRIEEDKETKKIEKKQKKEDKKKKEIRKELRAKNARIKKRESLKEIRKKSLRRENLQSQKRKRKKNKSKK